MEKIETLSIETASFIRGWNKLPMGQVVPVQEKIMDALSINSGSQFWRHLKGLARRSKAEGEAIERIFSEHGVCDIWGNE